MCVSNQAAELAVRNPMDNLSRATHSARSLGETICLTALFLFSSMSAQSAPMAYVTNFHSKNVSVINTATNTVSATIAVDGNPEGIAITPDGAFAYVVSESLGRVYVINTTTNTVTATVNLGGFSAIWIAITPDGAFAYVTSNFNNVTVIDTASNTVAATVNIGDRSRGIAITPDGAFAYVTRPESDDVSVIDVTTNTVATTVPVGNRPFRIEITPDGAFAYVTNADSDDVSVIDTVTNTVVATVAVAGAFPRGIAFTPDGVFAYVASVSGPGVEVINTATNTLATTVPVGSGPFAIGITPDGAFVYVPNFHSDNVSVIDTSTNTVIATVSVVDGPIGIAITPLPTVPTVSGLFAVPNLVQVNNGTVVTATVDDSSTGGSAITSADYNVNAGSYTSMAAQDGAFDSATEVVEATLPYFLETGVNHVCVRGTDELGHTSDPAIDAENACTLVVVYDPSGGFVTGGGWIYSAANACYYDALCVGVAGKANFGFVSRYKNGATIPTGNTEFQFSAGGLNFHSEVYDWLVVNMSGTNAQYKGSGTVNGNLSPAGGAYKFMLWGRDFGHAGTDTFRIKIWYVDAGTEIVVYDNGFNQPIGGGNIVVQAK